MGLMPKEIGIYTEAGKGHLTEQVRSKRMFRVRVLRVHLSCKAPVGSVRETQPKFR